MCVYLTHLRYNRLVVLAGQDQMTSITLLSSQALPSLVLDLSLSLSSSFLSGLGSAFGWWFDSIFGILQMNIHQVTASTTQLPEYASFCLAWRSRSSYYYVKAVIDWGALFLLVTDWHCITDWLPSETDKDTLSRLQSTACTKQCPVRLQQ